MRKTIFYLLLLAATSLPAQDAVYEVIADRLATYAQRTMAWDVEGMLDLTDPELFEMIPREVMADQLAGLRSDENLRVEVRDFTVEEIGELVSYGGEAFVPVTCYHRQVFTLLSAEYQAPAFRSRMQRMLEKNYGTGAVGWHAAEQQFVVTVRQRMFAVRRSAGADWHFIEYRAENAAMLDLLLPPVVRALVGLED